MRAAVALDNSHNLRNANRSTNFARETLAAWLDGEMSILKPALVRSYCAFMEVEIEKNNLLKIAGD